MMSNCAFWSSSGELLAVHGVRSRTSLPDSGPRTTFGPWAADRRLGPGRLVSLSPGFVGVSAPAEGWTQVGGPRRAGKTPRPCDPEAPVAAFAPAFDTSAELLLPSVYRHDQFTWKAWPTWVSTCRPDPGEGPEGWYAAIDHLRTNHFLVRLVPHQGRLPSAGWRNMLAQTVRANLGLRLVPLNGVPTAEALAAVPSWDYRAEAGQGTNAGAWDLQLVPTRRFLADAAPGTEDPWEATALVRWVRPGAPRVVPWTGTDPFGWADLFARLPVADARVLVQNVLTTLTGGAGAAAALFFDALVVEGSPEGRALVRRVPQPGLPLALLSTLFARRPWREVDRAKRALEPGTNPDFRAEVLAEVDRRLAEGRLVWSDEGRAVWDEGYRAPLRRALEAELAAFRSSDRWTTLLAGDRLVAEALLRSLDVTDLALCLRDAPDRRWRQYVTARREAEVKAEQAFCDDWTARGELTVERHLDAWRSWDALLKALPLTEPRTGT
jgi:hypothetical protein